jgi:hypothetical protein
MAWIGVITNAGVSLLAAWAAGGHSLTIDKATVGSGYHPAVNMRIATALAHEEAQAEIVDTEEEEGGTQFRIRVVATTGESYVAHEVGIWGHLDNGSQTLIAYHEDAEIGVTVPTHESMPGFFFDLYCVHAIGNDGTINIVVARTTFALRDELFDVRRRIESMTCGIEDTTTASIAYRQGQFLIFSDKLYYAAVDIAAGETLVEGENIIETKIMEQIIENGVRLSLIEHMIVHNDFYAPIDTQSPDGAILTDDEGAAILADWKYKII